MNCTSEGKTKIPIPTPALDSPSASPRLRSNQLATTREDVTATVPVPTAPASAHRRRADRPAVEAVTHPARRVLTRLAREGGGVPSDDGRFDAQLAPVATADGTVASDEGVRRGSTMDTLAGLRPAFDPEGVITAGNSSQISDGAAGLLMTTGERAARAGPDADRPGAHRWRWPAPTRSMMLTGPIPATRRVLDRSGLRAGRDRRLRGQRGVRLRAAGLARRDRGRREEHQPARGRHRAGPPAGRVRRPR